MDMSNSIENKIHELRILPQYFEEIYYQRKNFECRENDRDFKIGDYLFIKEYDECNEIYTGNYVIAKITYVLSKFPGITDGYYILNIKLLAFGKEKDASAT